MSLQKTKTDSRGIDGNYWKIINYKINDKDLKSRIVIGLFKDETAKSEGKDILEYKEYNWDGGNFPYSGTALDTNNPRKIAYDKMKVDDSYWSDATTV